jgi:hypothetical protein
MSGSPPPGMYGGGGPGYNQPPPQRQQPINPAISPYRDPEHNEMESPQIELDEYKNDFLEMNIGSLRAIMHHAQDILDSLNNPSVKENLTEPFLQQTAALAEDYMITIHNYVMFNKEETEAKQVEGEKNIK